MHARAQIFNKLTDLLAQINQKIPQPSNRYEQLECVPAGADLDQAITALKRHRKVVFVKSLEMQVAQHLQRRFDELLKQREISDTNLLTGNDWANIEATLLQEASTICAKLTRTVKLLEYDTVVDLIAIETAIKDNVGKLKIGERLTVDPDYAQHLLDDDKVAEHREICLDRYSIPDYLLSHKMRLKEQLEIATKSSYFWRGAYFSRPDIHVGYCDEHACIALLHLFNERFGFNKDDEIEKMSVSYGEGVNHTFLALFRDQKSQLDDITTWGKDAIIFDAWNRLVCFADEYQQLPHRFPLLHKNGKWSSIKFTMKDGWIAHHIMRQDTYWMLTGNQAPEVRLPRVMEEYQLTALSPAMPQTRQLLTAMAGQLAPDDFDLEVEFFISTAIDELVCVVNGFSEPKIAIHKELLEGLPTQYTVDELRFGIARALVQIEHYGDESSSILDAEVHHRLDKLALEKTKHASAAISYLRKSKILKDKAILPCSPNHELSGVLYYFVNFLGEASFEQRIKNLMTVLANTEALRVDHAYIAELPAGIANEMLPIKRHSFFSGGMASCNTKVEKIHWLITCLPELKIELLPFELTERPGIRVRHFCYLIESIGIDLKDREQRIAVDQLITSAMQLRIPEISLIYFTICGINFSERFKVEDLPPLGPFGLLQRNINDFVAAKDMATAQCKAIAIKSLLEELRNHFKHDSTYMHIRKYRKMYAGGIPLQVDRLFISELGRNIGWHSFVDNGQNDLPWHQHVSWAEKSHDSTIAFVLFRLGVTRDPKVLLLLDRPTLFGYSRKKPLVYLAGRLNSYGHLKFEQNSSFNYPAIVAKFTSELHQHNGQAFSSGLPFDEALKLYINTNLPALIAFNIKKGVNVDNASIKCLLEKFCEVAQSGSMEEKEIIRKFVLSDSDDICLYKLGRTPKGAYARMSIQHPIVQFVFKQSLFTNKEKIKFLHSNTVGRKNIPLKIYFELYEIPCEGFPLESVIELITKMTHDSISAPEAELIETHLVHIKYDLLSADTVKLFLYIETMDLAAYEFAVCARRIKWDLSAAAINRSLALSCVDLITIYKGYDTAMMFPSRQAQAVFGGLIMDRIRKEPAVNRLKALEALLYHRIPLSDYDLHQAAIDMLIDLLVEQYGIDDGTEAYFLKLKPVVDFIFKKASMQDRFQILSALAVCIESQLRLSDYLGTLFSPRDYLLLPKDSGQYSVIGGLANLGQALSKKSADQTAFLQFFSTPMTPSSLDEFLFYLKNNSCLNDLFKSHDRERMHQDYNSKDERVNNAARVLLQKLYYEFWDLTLSQRAVVIDYLLMPMDTVHSSHSTEAAYKRAFMYVSSKLFPHAASHKDEDFAVAVLATYLQEADPYLRSYLLSGMLVASNEAQKSTMHSRIGKKLAMIFEYMGPAYIKLGQCIHSHPDTPDSIRQDLHHLKGAASPVVRWQLWKLLQDVLPPQVRASIARVGQLLGSASYNLALDVTLHDGSTAVLSLLRTNAAKDAKDGFAHLTATISRCEHPRMLALRKTLLAMVTEAEHLSRMEMDKVVSQQQFILAKRLYRFDIKLDVADTPYTVVMRPVAMLQNGDGYRVIERAYGIEFNELPKTTACHLEIRKAVARAVITNELITILSGDCFDSDRHGNQLRISVDPDAKVITLGLYDFGELALDRPNPAELQQLAAFIRDVGATSVFDMLLASHFDNLLSKHIDAVIGSGQSARYLMRIRKAFLALQDFKSDLSTLELASVIKFVFNMKVMHPILADAVKDCLPFINRAVLMLGAAAKIKAPLRMFDRPAALNCADIPDGCLRVTKKR